MSTTKKRGSIRLANGKTEDEVIAEYLSAFTEAYERILKPERGFVYNDDLLGQVEGLAGTEGESRAIYWLQNARSAKVHGERIEAALNEGWVEAETLSDADRAKRPESVLIVGRGRVSDHRAPNGVRTTVIGASTEWIEIPEGRIVYDHASGQPTGVLPKGARTRGTPVTHRRVLVKLPAGKG